MTQSPASSNHSAAPKLLQWGRAHLTDQPVVWASTSDWNGLSLTSMRETDGEVVLPKMEQNALVQSVEGSKRHFASFASRSFSSAVRPGEIAAIPRGASIYSSWQNHGKLQTFHLVEFSPRLFEIHTPEIASEALLRGHLMPEGFAERPAIARLIALLVRETDIEHRRGRLFAETVARLLALEIANGFWTLLPDNLNAVPIGDSRIRRAIDFIEAHFTEDLSIQDIAAAAALSPSQLTVAFRRLLGKSPYSYVITRRLDQAIALLRQTELSIAHVALEAGFCDQAHLTRLCRARLGKTPRQIRQG